MFSEVVSTDAEGMKSVAYTEIIPVLIEAIKEQQRVIEQQQKDIGLLKKITASPATIYNIIMKTPSKPSSIGSGWKSAAFIIHGSGNASFRTSRGFTYIALLAAIVIIGITLGSAGKSWQNISQREKEEELLFRGNQYRMAIERYYNAVPGRHQFPNSIDDLLVDSRTSTGKRYLRQRYKDPITGEDFELIRDMFHGNTIKGVFSKSEKTPIKQANFPEELKDFEGKTKYSEWQFISGSAVITPAGMGPGKSIPPSTPGL